MTRIGVAVQPLGRPDSSQPGAAVSATVNTNGPLASETRTPNSDGESRVHATTGAVPEFASTDSVAGDAAVTVTSRYSATVVVPSSRPVA